jgi:hypothetical protein
MKRTLKFSLCFLILFGSMNFISNAQEALPSPTCSDYTGTWIVCGYDEHMEIYALAWEACGGPPNMTFIIVPEEECSN